MWFRSGGAGFELVAMITMFLRYGGIPSRFARIVRKKFAASPIESR